MKRKWKTVLMAAGILAAAAFSVSGCSLAGGEAGELPLFQAQEESILTAEETPAQETKQENAPENPGFTDQQKQELEELVSRCLDQSLSQALDAAVADSLARNLNAMMEDGRLPASIASYEMAQSGRINLNTADAKELTELTGIGEAKAQAILQYREEHGPFSSVDELVNVSGISSGIVEKLRDQVTL